MGAIVCSFIPKANSFQTLPIVSLLSWISLFIVPFQLQNNPPPSLRKQHATNCPRKTFPKFYPEKFAATAAVVVVAIDCADRANVAPRSRASVGLRRWEGGVTLSPRHPAASSDRPPSAVRAENFFHVCRLWPSEFLFEPRRRFFCIMMKRRGGCWLCFFEVGGGWRQRAKNMLCEEVGHWVVAVVVFYLGGGNDVIRAEGLRDHGYLDFHLGFVLLHKYR